MAGALDTPGTPPELFIVLDAVDVDKIAAFWVEAMHYRRVDRLEQYVVLVPREGAVGSVFLVQGVAEAKSIKNRMHLDLHVAGEVSWITMMDPEGNEFDLGRR